MKYKIYRVTLKLRRDYGRRVNYVILNVYIHSTHTVTHTCVIKSGLAEQYEIRYKYRVKIILSLCLHTKYYINWILLSSIDRLKIPKKMRID